MFFFSFSKGSHMWSNWWPYHQQQHRRCDKCAEYIVFFFFYSLTLSDRHSTEIEPNRIFGVINQTEYETIEGDNSTKFSIYEFVNKKNRPLSDCMKAATIDRKSYASLNNVARSNSVIIISSFFVSFFNFYCSKPSVMLPLLLFIFSALRFFFFFLSIFMDIKFVALSFPMRIFFLFSFTHFAGSYHWNKFTIK